MVITRRAHPRYQAAIPVHISSSDRVVSGRTQSVSMGGFFVAAEDSFGEGEDVELRLQLPTLGPVRGRGRVAYVIPRERSAQLPRSRPGMGVRFELLSAEATEVLGEYLELLERRTKGRVLLVHDDPAMANLLLDVLRDAGYSVAFATNAGQALEILGFGDFDVVVVQAAIPRMDGLELTYAVRMLPTATDMGVVLLTRRPLDTQQWRAAEQLDVHDVLTEPVTLEQFLQAVDSSLPPSAWVQETGEPVGLWDEPATLDPTAQKRRASLAEQHLTRLGVRTRRTTDGAGVFGELPFLHTVVRMPFQRSIWIRAVKLVAVGEDAIKIYDPPALAALPPLPVANLSDRSAVERMIAAVVAARERMCLANKSWLERLHVPGRLDPDRFVCFGQLEIAGDTVVFSVVTPQLLQLERIGTARLERLLRPEERQVRAERDIEDFAQLELYLGLACTRARRLLQRRGRDS